MQRLLLLNCIEADKPRRSFDEQIAPRLGEQFGGAWEVAHLAADSPLPSPQPFSHLVLSGSELSAAQENPRDAELMDSIRAFVEADRNVFGICYGHQMIGRALSDTFCCRRAETPEFGWKSVELEPDRIFTGIAELVAVQSHYDELFDLPQPFRTIARTDHCGVQAFAYGTRAVWGTQFHPEQPYDLGTAMLEDNLRTESRASELFVNQLGDPGRLRNNERLFDNFFRATAA